MSKKFKIYLPSIIVTVIVNLLVAGALLVYADWTAPLSRPPTCNVGDPGCDAPINVGDSPQFKIGPLSVGGLVLTYSDAYFAGNVGIGTFTPKSRLQVVGDYIQIPAEEIVTDRWCCPTVNYPPPNLPPKEDCDETEEAGRMFLRIKKEWANSRPRQFDQPVTADNEFWLCTGRHYIGNTGFPRYDPIYTSGWAEILSLNLNPERLP